MRHSFAILAACIFAAMPFRASAQLQIGEAHPAVNRVATVQQMWSWIYEMDGRYYFVTKTDNQFDDNIWLDLGPGKDDAAKTILALFDALESAKDGESIEITSAGEKFLLTCTQVLGSRAWYVSAIDTRKVYAGRAPVNGSALRKAYRVLTKK